MLSLAQDLLAAGIALAAYALGVRVFLGRCQRLVPPPAMTLSSHSNDNGNAMRAPRPAAEPADITPVSIAAGMGAIFVLCGLAAVACARAHGWM